MKKDTVKKYLKEGDILIDRNKYFDDFYRIKSITEKSVLVEKLEVDFTLEFDEEDFRKTCMKEENYELFSPNKIQLKKYRYIQPKYTFILKEKPNNEVLSTIRMTFEDDKYDDVDFVLSNKSKCLEIYEKISGEFVKKEVFIEGIFGGNYCNVFHYEDGKTKIISELYDEIIEECFKKSDEMTQNYYKTQEGIKEEEEYKRRIKEECNYSENIDLSLKNFCKIITNHRITTGKIDLSPDEVEDYIDKLYEDCSNSLWRIITI